MRRLLIVTHGTFAEGIRSSVSVLAGNTEMIEVINCFVEGGEFSPQNAILKFIESIPPEDEILILTDLFGGSVNNMATVLVTETGREKLHLVTGTNLALAVELFLYPDDLTPEIINETIEQAKTGIKYMNDEIPKMMAIDTDKDDFFAD